MPGGDEAAGRAGRGRVVSEIGKESEQEKAGHCPAFSLGLYASALFAERQFLHARVELALVPGRLVAVDDALVDHRIDDRAAALSLATASSLLPAFHGVRDALDRGTEPRAERHVVGSTLDGLTRSLFS